MNTSELFHELQNVDEAIMKLCTTRDYLLNMLHEAAPHITKKIAEKKFLTISAATASACRIQYYSPEEEEDDEDEKVW